MQYLFDAIGKWSDSVFAEDRGPEGAIHHLELEVQELKADPYDLEEYADCQMLLFDAARMAGFSLEDLEVALQIKLEKNKRRKWGKDLGNGAIGHLPDEPNPESRLPSPEGDATGEP
jgi:hypothetical protein